MRILREMLSACDYFNRSIIPIIHSVMVNWVR